MKNFFVLIFTSGILVSSSMAQGIDTSPRSDRQTYYHIDAILNDSSKSITGIMEAYWVNKSAESVPEVRLHMYMNAFRSSNTTFNKESERSLVEKKSALGWIDIKSLTDRKGVDIKPFTQFISPDDGNISDSTVLKINLLQPARPGDTVFLKIDFEVKLPSRIIRTGYADDFYFVAQWFPKFGVYETAGMRYAINGGWNCHQFHANSEFYSNHSLYDVKITLPKKYVVGSGGLLMAEADAGDGKKTLTFRADDIVDFAWTAWPEYVVFKDEWKGINITLLLPPGRENQSERQLKAVKYALEYFTENVGPYPWNFLTFVDPPKKGEGAAGMEYTTLFTSASFTGIPSYLHLPEVTTIHEFGHAYFMGILASNEAEEPWLDEGVNSFWEERIVDHYYGKNSGFVDHPWLKISDASNSRMSYVNSINRQVVSNNEYSWNYPHGTYGMMSYMKTATWLNTLMGIIGEENMNNIFREYYRKWAFKHPSGKDFVNVVSGVISKNEENKFGLDLNRFFEQTLYGTGICDYKVSGFHNEKVFKSDRNLERSDSISKNMSDSDSLYKSVVELIRIGEVILPVEVLIHFDNGDEVKEMWNGESRYKDYKFTGKRKIQWVKIDPEYKITMDVNYINNSMTDEPDHMPVKRMTNKLVSFMQFFINLILL